MQEYLRLYYAIISQVDHGVGRVLATLEELGIREDMAIVFTSDHGDMQGSHGHTGKQLPYEKSCGIPLIVSVPEGRKNHHCDCLISGIDLYPTILDMVSIPQKDHLQGKSFADYIFGREDTCENTVFAENMGKTAWKMVRHGDYKLAIDSDTQEPTVLFNVKDDPLELHNLVGDPAHQKRGEQLCKMIRDVFVV